MHTINPTRANIVSSGTLPS